MALTHHLRYISLHYPYLRHHIKAVANYYIYIPLLHHWGLFRMFVSLRMLTLLQIMYDNITSFYGSCANNGKGAINTQETLPELCMILVLTFGLCV